MICLNNQAKLRQPRIQRIFSLTEWEWDWKKEAITGMEEQKFVFKFTIKQML